MSDRSKIEWTDATWNPVRGCTKVSTGCRNCYAERFAERWRGIPGHPFEQGFDVRLVPKTLEQPLRWRKPRRILVCSMSDLFHADVPFDFIDKVFGTMAVIRQHTYQMLTKRPERMAEYLAYVDREAKKSPPGWDSSPGLRAARYGPGMFPADGYGCYAWPLANVWLGTSVENQETADQRIPELLKCPAAVRFISCEPLLGPIGDLGLKSLKSTRDYEFGDAARARIHWVIVGCESGPGARPMELDWVRSIRDQCVAANVPFFFKQAIIRSGRKCRKTRVSMPELDGRQWTEIPNGDGEAEFVFHTTSEPDGLLARRFVTVELLTEPSPTNASWWGIAVF